MNPESPPLTSESTVFSLYTKALLLHQSLQHSPFIIVPGVLPYIRGPRAHIISESREIHHKLKSPAFPLSITVPILTSEPPPTPEFPFTSLHSPLNLGSPVALTSSIGVHSMRAGCKALWAGCRALRVGCRALQESSESGWLLVLLPLLFFLFKLVLTGA